MNWEFVLTAFATIFLAELGDKTQLASMALAARSGAPLSVFLGAISALALVTLIGVVFGALITSVIPESYIRAISGAMFIVIGFLMLAGRL
ncbi:MAG: TMEM165/GDT1 family protein [Chloroflexota bacterium]